MSACLPAGRLCGRSSSVEHQLPKLDRRVQFPSPALITQNVLNGDVSIFNVSNFRGKIETSPFILKMKSFKFYILVLIFEIFVLSFTGCAPVAYVKPSVPYPGMPGIYHRVERGQTLWRISKIYNVDLEEIARVNHISDASSLEVGQSLFIPYAQTSRVSASVYTGDDFTWPLRGKIIASFGQTFDNMINKGINIQSYSSSNVVASRSGKVTFLDEHFGGFGKTVIIDHQDGFSTVYAMNSQLLIKPGDYVQKGSVIARASNLHFEVRKGHLPQNPLFYLP